MSSYQIKSKTTDELSHREWSEIKCAFNNVFNHDYSLEYFKKKYCGSALGFSGHGILYFEDIVVGSYTAIPQNYRLNNQDILIALSCDAFILKDHRKDELFLKEMADAVIDRFKDYGIDYYISIPNQIAYPYWKYYADWKDIGELNYYIVPLRISKLLKIKHKFLDILTLSFFKFIISIPNFKLNRSVNDKSIGLVYDSRFIKNRYNSSEYFVKNFPNDGSFIYRFYNEEGLRVVYLLDCYPKSKFNFKYALKKIIKEHYKDFDLLIHVGVIESKPFFLLKVPKRFEPRKQPFIGYYSGVNDVDFFFDIRNWNISLGNFDNR